LEGRDEDFGSKPARGWRGGKRHTTTIKDKQKGDPISKIPNTRKG
jgi:hypothetical protein